uniref:Fibronectin type-III domain-containing protein n=1 Tax=Pogona vitticeps TaxID=103695 RepID=A0ABM5GM78_9SAUR
MAGLADGVEMPALGRPFRLGMLYNCHKDALLQEHMLFDPEACQKNAEQLNHNTEVAMRVSCETLDEKAAALGIKPSLLTSLLCGLFEAKGPAEYLFSPLRSRRPDGRITYMSSSLERLEKLNLNSLRPEVISHQNIGEFQATHVVTGVWYGTRAVWDYENDATPSDQMEEKAAPEEKKKVAFLSEGQTSLKTDDKEDEKHILSNPGTLPDPMNGHPNLSRLLGKAEEKGVPIKIHLYPLNNLQLPESLMPCCAQSFHELSDVLHSGIKEAMAGLVELEAEGQALSSAPAGRRFPEIGKKIQKFREQCHQSRQGFREQLAKMVPSVRTGEKEEKDLEKVLAQAQESGLQLRRSFDKRKKEVGLLNSVLSSLKESKAVGLKAPPEASRSPGAGFVVAFMFTSLHEEDPYFPEQKRHLPSRRPQSEFKDKTHGSGEWHEDEAIVRRVRETARSFLAFARANQASRETEFLVDSVPDKSRPGAAIYLYEGGDLKGTSFEPPSKPLPLKVEKVSPDSVQLRVTPASFGKEAISGYQIEHRLVGEERWLPSILQKKEDTSTVRGLWPDTEYEFRYAAVSKPGCSESSDVTDPVKTLPAASLEGSKSTPAGSPGLLVGSQGSGAEERNAAEGGERDPAQPRAVGGKEKSGAPLAFPSASLTERGTAYHPDPKGMPKDVACSLCQASRILREGTPSVYALPLEKVAFPAKAPWRKYRFGKQEDPQVPHRVVVLLGETGAGKSMMVDGMMNYLLGVQWEDEFRFSLVQEDPRQSQAESRTDTLTAYEVHLNRGWPFPCSLTLIDTPGFGDTRGRQRDQVLLEKIREFFNSPGGLRHIDAVCIVVQASQPRLTQLQKYIFDQVFSVFGRDIGDNIQILVTFADGQTPPVVEALKAGEVTCATHAAGTPAFFPFNNSALFASNVLDSNDEDSYHFNRMFWEMGLKSMKTFFQSLSNLQPRRLTSLADILDEPTLQGVRHRVQMALVALRQLRETCRVLEEHWRDMVAHKDFEYEVESVLLVKRLTCDPRNRAVNCQNCSYTCQYVCGAQNNRGNVERLAMNTPHCMVCPGQCIWQNHFSGDFVWDYQIVKEKRSFAGLKRRYQGTSRQKMTENDVCSSVLLEADQAEKELVRLIEMLTSHLQKLPKSALKSSPITFSECIDLLIRSEEKERQLGFKERALLLRNLKERVLPNTFTRKQ